jgi:hypothetical protein
MHRYQSLPAGIIALIENEKRERNRRLNVSLALPAVDLDAHSRFMAAQDQTTDE